MIVFLDLETTGLDPTKDVILEAAAVITDDAFDVIAGQSWVAYWHGARLLRTPTPAHLDRDAAAKTLYVDPIVVDMHTKNGLWNEAADSTLARGDVDVALYKFIAAHCQDLGEKHGPQLAGNTISFDRAFLRAQLRTAHDALHYRNIDMTTLNELARRFKPELHAARPRLPEDRQHRAYSDVEDSLALARYYRDALFA